MLNLIKKKEKWITVLLIGVGLILVLTNRRISPYISYSLPSTVTADVTFTPSPTKEIIFTPSRTPTVLISQSIQIPQIKYVVPQALREVGEQKAIQKDFSVIIPKIDVTAPVIPNVDGSNSNTYLKVLENGVAHFDGTSYPDQIGRTFIFGHSSYFRNKPGNYKQIFAGLDNLVNGDDILVWFKGELFQYRVVQKKFVTPSDLSVLLPTSSKTLTLQACWPIGSTKERIIIDAEQVM